MRRYYGRIVDATTNEPVSNATVELWNGNIMLAAQDANASGYFDMQIQSAANAVKVSRASYKPAVFNVSVVEGDEYPLTPNVVEGENVIIDSIKKNPGRSLLIAFAILFLLAKKR